MLAKILAGLCVMTAAVQAASAEDWKPAYAAKQEADEALKIAADAAAQNDAETASAQRAKAQVALKRAANQFVKAGVAASSDIAALRDYAEIRVQLQDYDLAAETCQRLVALDPQDVMVRLLLGNCLTELGSARANDAIAVLRAALDLHPADAAIVATAHISLGRVYRKEALYDLAREQYLKALEADPASVTAKIALAADKVRLGRMAEASADLDALSPLTPEVASQLGPLLADSLTIFRESRRTFADSADNHIGYAKILFRANRVAECLYVAQRAAVLDPSNHATWNFIGDIARQTNNPALARDAYQKSLQIKADQPVTQKSLEEIK